MSGQVITIDVTSVYYGSVRWQYLGTVDVVLDVGGVWSEKHHPAKFFTGACWGVVAGQVMLKDCNHLTTFSWGVWVPTKSVNKGWKAVAGTEYFDRKPTYRGCPIAYSDARVAKWLAKSHAVLVDNPSALKQAQTSLK